MKKILFPFELDNPLYNEAYVYAVKFARNMNAELIMLNTFKFEVDDNITEETYNLRIKKNWLRAFNEVVKFNEFYLEQHVRVNDELKVRFDHRFVFGRLLTEIKKILHEEKIDLVVLPVSDNKEINRKQFQIIHDDIFEMNQASLLIVPLKSIFRPVKNIVFATDLKKLHVHELYLNEVLKYSEIFDSNIHFLHVSPKEKSILPEDTEAYQTMMRIIRMNKRHIFQSLYGKDVFDTIQQYIQRSKAELLVVVKHESFFLDPLFHKSISDELSLKSAIPVLIMREKDV